MSCTISEITQGVDLGRLMSQRENPSREQLEIRRDRLLQDRKNLYSTDRNSPLCGGVSFGVEAIDNLIDEIEQKLAQYDKSC